MQAKHKAENLIKHLHSSTSEQLKRIIQIIRPKIVVGSDRLEIQIQKAHLKQLLDQEINCPLERLEKKNPFTLSSKALIKEKGEILILMIEAIFSSRKGRTQITNKDGNIILAKSHNHKSELINLIVQGHFWKKKQEKLSQDEFDFVKEESGLSERYISKLVNVTYLSTKIKKLIFQRKQPDSLTGKDLLSPFPLCWREQEEFLRIQ